MKKGIYIFILFFFSTQISAAVGGDSRKLASLLKDKNIGTIELHYFDPVKNDDAGADGGLGLKYDIKLEDNFGDELDLSKNQYFFSYMLKAEGTKTANSEKNRHDYAKNSLAIKWNSIRNIDQGVAEDCINLNNPDTPIDDSCYIDKDQYLLDFSLQISDESSQADDSYAKAYGLTFDFIFHPNSTSPFTKYNIFDLPFRAIRQITRYTGDGGETYAFPKLHFAYENIDPSKDDERKVIDPNLNDYDRLHAELAFVSVLGAIDNRELRFSASWRLWQEIDANQAIKAAHLDRPIYRVYSLSLDGGFLLSYTSGRVPFDRHDDQVWALGYKIHW